MAELIDVLFERFEEHWIKILTAAVFMAAGWFLGKRRAQKNWQRREFFDRLNISLNIIQNGKLQIRTLLEKRCEEIFLNSQAANVVIDSAKKTTAEDPLLPLDSNDYWYYLNSVLNEIAEKFAIGPMKRDLGADVQSDEYIICLTCEAAGNLKMRKVRALLIKKSLLTNLPEEQPALESPNHSTRWATLNQLAAAYQKSPERFLSMEISL